MAQDATLVLAKDVMLPTVVHLPLAAANGKCTTVGHHYTQMSWAQTDNFVVSKADNVFGTCMFLMQSYTVIRCCLRDSLPLLYLLIHQINHVGTLFSPCS